MTERPAVAVLGLGNVLRRDDGVGPFLIKILEGGYEFPDGVSLLDLGTPGPEFVDYLLEVDIAIVIDSVAAAGTAGDVLVFDREQILSAPLPERLSPHDPSLREALLTAELAGQGPSTVILVGVIPESTELGTELTTVVRAALPRAEAEVVRQLRGLGIEPATRAGAAKLEIWWER
jgi:hydrogenase maturation protease